MSAPRSVEATRCRPGSRARRAGGPRSPARRATPVRSAPRRSPSTTAPWAHCPGGRRIRIAGRRRSRWPCRFARVDARGMPNRRRGGARRRRKRARAVGRHRRVARACSGGADRRATRDRAGPSRGGGARQRHRKDTAGPTRCPRRGPPTSSERARTRRRAPPGPSCPPPRPADDGAASAADRCLQVRDFTRAADQGPRTGDGDIRPGQGVADISRHRMCPLENRRRQFRSRPAQLPGTSRLRRPCVGPVLNERILSLACTATGDGAVSSRSSQRMVRWSARRICTRCP